MVTSKIASQLKFQFISQSTFAMIEDLTKLVGERQHAILMF